MKWKLIIAVGQFIGPGYTIKLTGECSVFLKVFRKRSNYTSHIQKKTDQAVSQFHISSYSSRRGKLA